MCVQVLFLLSGFRSLRLRTTIVWPFFVNILLTLLLYIWEVRFKSNYLTNKNKMSCIYL